MALYWLSFVDDERPKGSQFLGAAIVEAENSLDAVRVAHHLGCNPGGEVAIRKFPPGVEVRAEDIGRLMLRPEAEAWRPTETP